MRQRVNTPELIDLGPSHYTSEEYNECLYQLGRIGRLLGGDRATIWAFNQLPKNPKSILDVGCGGGQITRKLAYQYPQAKVRGIDLSKEAIAFAKAGTNPLPRNLKFSICKTPELLEPPKSVDVVTSTLVCHHLSDDEIIDFLKRSLTIAREAVIFNDLHRHPLATLVFSAIAPICFRNRLIYHDGLLSIKRAFKRSDILAFLDAAKIPRKAFSLTWHCPFRWILIVYPKKL
ncbi:MAG: methyltransferase domain-containing protein [Parachlamydiaceae bacterium]|nr:methyltransferase domain-containing protein [Parachlamydiaceae bacterium]